MSSELKAKRTHARRSCDLCKVRKTRCELPDLDVASSTEPQPADKACHRCRVLALPCIVDDTSRKRGKKALDDDAVGSGTASPLAPGPSRKPRKATSNGDGNSNGATTGRAVNHDMDLMHAFHPSLDYIDDAGEIPLRRGSGSAGRYAPYDPFVQPSSEAGPSSRRQSNSGSGAGAGTASSEEVAEAQEEAMKYHGRALELVCAMLRVAYGKTKMNTGRKASKEFELQTLITPKTILRLEGSLMQLKTLHPYLDPFAKDCKDFDNHPPADKLFLAVILYLCTQPLPADRWVLDLRAALPPFIEQQRDIVLLSQEQSFWSIQALELLAMHAPFGLLPLQAGNPRNLSLARGQVNTARFIAESLAFPNLARVMVVVTERYNYFEESDYWLWVCMNIQECSVALECETMSRPKHITGIVTDVEKLLSPSNEHQWITARDTTDAATLIGRLGVVDRACRFGEVFDRLERLRGVLETAAQDADFDPVGAMVEELTSFGHRIDQLDQRHDYIMSLLAPSAGGIEAGWLGYRSLTKRSMMNKVHMIGIRYIIATAYLPGHPLAFPNLKVHPGSVVSTRLSFAIKKAQQPADVMAFLQRSDAGVQAVWNFGVHRGNISEQLLGAFVDLESVLLPGPAGSGISAQIVPLHEVIAVVTESSKYLMEVEGAATLMKRSAVTASRHFKPPTWVYTMQQACGLLNRLGAMSEQASGAESIANGCSNILGSMLRITHEWMKSSASGTPSGSIDEGASAGATNGQTGQAIAAAFADGSGNSLPPPSLADAIRSLPPAPPEHTRMAQAQGPEDEHHATLHNQQMLHAQVQQYMDTSDRWMAGDHSHVPPAPPPHYAPNGRGDYGDPAHYAPHIPVPHVMPHQHAQATNLDLLLSQMFNYSGPAGAPRHTLPRNMPMEGMSQGLGAGSEQFAAETGGWSNVYESH